MCEILFTTTINSETPFATASSKKRGKSNIDTHVIETVSKAALSREKKRYFGSFALD